MRASNLRTDFLINPIGIDVRKPILSWTCQDGMRQSAYEIQAVSKGEAIWSSGKVLSNRMRAEYHGETKSRQKIYWRVRLWDEKNEPGEWSQEAFFEMGLLNQEDFCAAWINPEDATDSLFVKPASYLKREFEIDKLGNARLYITCHGVYEAHINGRRVGDFVLAPGFYDYDKRIAYQTYDVTTLLRKGRNQVEVILGDGWYRGASVTDGKRNLYGDSLALYFQLEVDEVPVCISDEQWQASQHGPILENDLQLGEVVDARLEKVDNYHSVKVEKIGTSQMICSNSVPICEMERFQGEIRRIPNGGRIIDFGQNISGYIEFTLDAKAGQTIVLIHGEELDSEGNFTQENFLEKEDSRTQRVTYICKEGLNHYKTKFSIWGFRYVKIETDIDISRARFTAIAVYSKMAQTASFECSDSRVNKLVENCLWSQKSNFCDVPTNRATGKKSAVTGDMGVYIGTGLTLMDCYPFVRKWLGEWRKCQFGDGRIDNVIPRNGFSNEIWGNLPGAAGWGDASIIVPYVMYRRYGDIRILKENYTMMTGWYDYLLSRAKRKSTDIRKRYKKRPYRKYLIETGMDYGEIFEPNVSDYEKAGKPNEKLATAYLAASGAMLSDIAKRLGRNDEARRYLEISDNAKKAYRYLTMKNGRINSDRQAEYVRAIAFGLLDDKEQKQAARDLNQMVIDNDYHLNTGFLTTSELCRVLADNGYVKTAYLLLLQDTAPSWLYPVKQGATTIWEDWKGVDSRGTVKASHNHYSFGAVCGWLFEGVCGINVVDNEIYIKPQPCRLLSYAKASYESPLGTIESSWRYEDDEIQYEINTPVNVVTHIKLPTGEETKSYGGKVYLSRNTKRKAKLD